MYHLIVSEIKIQNQSAGLPSFWSSEGESVFLTFSTPRGYLHSLTCGPFLHLQNQQHSIFSLLWYPETPKKMLGIVLSIFDFYHLAFKSQGHWDAILLQCTGTFSVDSMFILQSRHIWLNLGANRLNPLEAFSPEGSRNFLGNNLP